MRRLFKVGADRHDNGRLTFTWHPEGNFLASAGKNGIVQITDRHGDIVDEIPMNSPSPILALAWDKDGDNLAILQEGNGVVPLWSLSNRRVVPLDTNLRDPVFIDWSKSGPQLAIGTAKGNLLIYNKAKKQKIPIVGKHAKKITCGSWSNQGNKLALGSDDRTLTISNENGDTLLHTELKNVPTQALFTCTGLASGPKGNSNDDIVSSNLNGKSLHLLNILDENDEPTELSFAPAGHGGCKYGDIIQHHWLEENLLLVGFSGGYLTVVSTASNEMGVEKQCSKFHSSMSSFSYNPHLKRVATAGDDGIRIIDMQDFKECKSEYVSPEDLEDGRIIQLAWSPDGQILTVGTNAGNVYNFLAKMSVIYAKYKTTVAYLSSLREVSVVDAVKRGRPVDVSLKLEPSILAIGGKYIAAGMNNRIYYHKIVQTNKDTQGSMVIDHEYVGTIREVQLNQLHTVVFTDNKAILHLIEQSTSDSSQNQTKTFPNRDEGSFATITCIALTDDFLYYGTEAGTVEIFFLTEWVLLAGAELRLDNSIKQIYPNHNGTRVVVVDNASNVFLFNPVSGGGVNQSIVKFEAAPGNISKVIWDSQERNIIMLYDGKYLHTYVYIQSSMKGSLLTKLGPVEVSPEGDVSLKPDKVELIQGNVPIVSSNGVITCQATGGTLSTILHPYFDQLIDNISMQQEKSRRRNNDDGRTDMKTLIERFCQCLALLKLEQAWQAALELDKRQFWLALSGKAMETLNVELASRIYRQLGDAAMVMALQEYMYVEDKLLLAGYISLLFCDYSRAQELFLSSSRPQTALEMRKDLLQWDQALKLAQALNGLQIPEICIQYGMQLEFHDDATEALHKFEMALDAQDSSGNTICPESLVALAMRGIARCQLRLGNLRQGIRISDEINDKVLYQECGDILEQQKQYSEAVTMHVKGDRYERAAYIYTKYLIKADKSKITEAAAIMDKVNNDSLHSTFAKACAAAGRYDEAMKAYEKSKDIDKVVELKLRHLDKVQEAFDLVRTSLSAQGALVVSEYCHENSDYRGAIEFLLIANKQEDAFKLAQANSLVEVFAALLGDNITAEFALKVAHYYEKSQEHGMAGKFYSMCGQYNRALKLFMQCGDREIDAAIDVVGKSQSEDLQIQLLDFLVGDRDGVPKDDSGHHIHRLYIALKKYDEAAKTALIIASQEQSMGNYQVARAMLFNTIRQLEDAGIKVLLQLRQQFVLIHSYLLVKSLVKAGDHTGAARMLLRVAKSVSKFPSNAVAILTSTVIECHRANLKSTAYDYALILMRPEYRPSIDPNIKKKIEAIVRRRIEKTEEANEDTGPCPVSGEQIPLTQLESNVSRDALPMCIITGKFITLNDFCFCPVSKFPALYSEYLKYIKGEHEANGGVSNTAVDPILGKPVSVSDITLLTAEDAKKYIQVYNNVLEEKKKEDDEDTENVDGNANDTKKKCKGKHHSSRSRRAERNRSAKSDKDGNIEEEKSARK